MLEKQKLAAVLRMIADLVEKSSPEEMEKLQHLSLADVLADAVPKKKGKRKQDAKSDAPELRTFIEGLNGSTTREEAASKIDQASLGKADLEVVARELHLPVLREDSSKRLVEKIVEATVGSRLNSLAIRSGTR